MEKPRKLLVRSWLPGRGCVHQCSEAMSEAEARGLLDAAGGAIDKAQESERIEVIRIANGRAFVVARRSPDPDQPSRMAPGFVLVSVPDSEIDELLHSAAKRILDNIPPLELESDLGARGWR